MLANGAEELFQRGLKLHTAGDLRQAEILYRQIIDRHQHLGALCNLGQILRTQGKLQESLQYQQQACSKPDATAEMHFNLGNALRQADQLSGALVSYQQALLLKPDLALGHCAVGIIVQALEGAVKAQRHFQRAIELDQGLWRAWFGRAQTGLETGPSDDAISDLQRAAKLAPEQLKVWRLLAVTLAAKANLPGQLHAVLIQACQHWAELDGSTTQPLLEIASREWAFKNHEAAINALRAAVKRTPDDFNTVSFLSLRLTEVHHVGEAERYCQQALALQPDDMTMLAHAGKLQMLQGDVTAAVTGLGALYAKDKQAAYEGRNWLFASLYDETLDAKAITERHIQVTKAWYQVAEKPEFDVSRSTPKRIGYITPDLTGDHPVAQFFEPILAAHQSDQLDIYIYSATEKIDHTTRRCQQLTPHWHNVQAMDDQAVADLIRLHRIDVLIDLAGHTKGSRISVFGYRPAPVQICWLGYPYTTGHPQCDYLLADKIVCPPQQAHLYSEELLYLPDCVFCVPKLDPELINSGPAKNKPITFGNFGAFQKITPHTFDLWVKVLHSVPDSRLLLKNGSFADSDLREQFAKRLIAAGIGSNRFELRQPSPFAQMMEEYNSMDVVLDTLAYNGGTTAFHALWMGVPTLTLPGDKFCNRMGASIMQAACQQDWVANDQSAYIKQAQQAAQQLSELRSQRRVWRDRIQTKPFADHTAFNAQLAQLISKVWTQVCE